jgi:3-methyladenine DNA glycosylase AlkD
MKRLARPVGAFDAGRYFRSDVDLDFLNVGTPTVRAVAKTIYAAHRDQWSVDDALTFADVLIRDRYFEAKALAVEVLACYRRVFTPRLLPAWKRWLVRNDSSNWATTDAICGYLIGPLLVAYPTLVPRVAAWSADRNVWVRRASAVSLIPSVRKGVGVDAVYAVARRLHADREDLIQKAVGWLLREAGTTDMARLERHLRVHGPAIPRVTVRYAIERMPEGARKAILSSTRAGRKKAGESVNPAL